MHHSAFTLLTTRYLSGEASATERARLEVLMADPALKAQFDEWRIRWEASGEKLWGKFDVNTALERLSSTIREDQDVPSARKPRP